MRPLQWSCYLDCVQRRIYRATTPCIRREPVSRVYMTRVSGLRGHAGDGSESRSALATCSEKRADI